MAHKRRSSGSGARQGSARFYSGRTTHTSSEQKKLRKQKEYRRQKLSKQKRLEFLEKLKGKLRWAFGVVLLLVLVNIMQIKSVEYIGLTGLSDGDKQVITGLADDYLGGARSFKSFFSAEDFEMYLLENAPFVSRVEASTSLLDTKLKIRVTPKTPAYGFRGTENNNSQWIAQDGTLITLTTEQIAGMGSNTPALIITDTSGVAYSNGDAVIPVSTLDFMSAFTLDLALEGHEVTGYEVNENPRELALTLAGEKYRLIVAVERPTESLLKDFTDTLAELKRSNKVAENYIDLRVVDKVFYK